MASVSESASRSSSGADSYIGCLISLTSKSEIRYEGVLYDINTDESSIGLRNVRSFGTEGRKKDGQQVPPGDKIYEYILFRGSDIKDLQVKSSPPVVQPTPPINNDPAIIQSHYPRPPTASAGLPSAGSGSLTDLNSLPPQLGHPGSNFQGALPLYQPGGNIGSWGVSPAPGANAGGLAMPMYWQGYYGAPNGLPSLPQQSLLRPPPGLPIPSSMQQQMHYPNLNPSLPSGTSNLPDFPPSLIPSTTSTSSLVVGSVSLQPPNLPLTLPLAPSATLTSETLPASAPIKAPAISLPAGPTANLSSLPFPSSSDVNAVVPPVPNKPNTIPAPSLPYQAVSQLMHAVTGSSNSIPTEPLQPSLVTPGQLLQSGPSMVSSSQSSQTAQKDAKVIQKSSVSLPDPASPVSAEAQPPILPLPVTSRTSHRPSGAPVQNYGYGYRGRGRGRGIGTSRPVTKFTEDFDFTAMNEKFKKDEVWGHLGKSNKSHSKEKDGDENVSEEEDIEDEDNGEALKPEIKPVYNKDDFFDTLSSNALDNDSQNGRIRYSEQLKLDTETFGDFMRHRGGRGGRGPMRGGRTRGGYGYNGRGYGGYAGRGRGRGMINRTS